MPDEAFEFWAHPFQRSLNSALKDLVEVYGRPAVSQALKGMRGGGRPADPIDFELRVSVARHEASLIDGSGNEVSDYALKEAWAAKFPPHEAKKRKQQLHRILKERRILGLACALNERWHKMNEPRRRLALREIASLPSLPEEIRNYALELAGGDSSELEEAPPSRGMIPDRPGLPRLGFRVRWIADTLLRLAFRHGRPPEQKPR
jgi:hypothetical protein